MKASKLIPAMTMCITMLSPAVYPYDAERAADFAELFAPAQATAIGKAMHFIKPAALVKDMRDGKDLVLVDIRTPAETALYGFATANSLAIPMHEIFEAKNLARLPNDRTMIIVCKSGVRATAVGTALRHIGFDNVFILSGGFQALSAYYGTGEAYAADSDKQ